MPRTWVLVAVVASAVGCALVATIAVLAPGARPSGQVAPVAASDRTAPLAVLRAWDQARADAWRRGDPTALDPLYAGGSRSGVADRRLLAAYDARGLRVHGLGVQRAAVEVEQATPRRVVLVVTDRLTGGWVRTRAGERVDLPRDRWSTRQVVLVAREGGWRVVEVRDRDGRGPTTPPR
jgi:hypothetical protein